MFFELLEFVASEKVLSLSFCEIGVEETKNEFRGALFAIAYWNDEQEFEWDFLFLNSIYNQLIKSN